MKKYKKQVYETGYYVYNNKMQMIYHIKDLNIYWYSFRNNSWQPELGVYNELGSVVECLIQVPSKVVKLKGIKLYE